MGNISLCEVFFINLSNSNIIAGKIVTTLITPNKTPFAITIPISFPSVRFMLHNAKNPAIVVSELPNTAENVFCIAADIASFILLVFSCSAL